MSQGFYQEWPLFDTLTRNTVTFCSNNLESGGKGRQKLLQRAGSSDLTASSFTGAPNTTCVNLETKPGEINEETALQFVVFLRSH